MLFLDISLQTNLSYNGLKPLKTGFIPKKSIKQVLGNCNQKCGWSKLDKNETNCEILLNISFTWLSSELVKNDTGENSIK